MRLERYVGHRASPGFCIKELGLYPKAHRYVGISYPSTRESSSFSTSWPTLVGLRCFDTSYPDGCDMIAYCGFGLHFPGD